MKTIDRYLCSHFFYSLAGVLFIITLFILIAELRDIYGDILAENPDPKWILLYFALVMPGKIGEVIPLVTAVGVLWTLLRLSRQNELLAFFCGGRSPLRLSVPFLGIALGISLGLLMLNESLVHRCEEAATYIFKVHIQKKSHLSLRKNTDIFQKGAGRSFYSMSEYIPDTREMLRPTILILQEEGTQPQLRLDARRAVQIGPESGSLWRFYDVVLWHFDARGHPQTVERKEVLNYPLESGLSTLLGQPRKPTQMNFLNLLRYTRVVQNQGYPVSELLTELHLKMAFPLAPLVVTLLVCSFSLHPRAGRMFVQFGGGVALVLLYYVATVMLRKLGHGSVLTPSLAAWLPNGVFLLLGGYWFFRRTNM